VHSADKVVKTQVSSCRPAVGIAATNDADSLLALGADCVCYACTTELRPLEGVQEISSILASGANVVSSSPVALVYPKSSVPELRDPLDEACRKGGTSLFISGIDPGFVNDVFL
jgi:hypothetical protein